MEITFLGEYLPFSEQEGAKEPAKSSTTQLNVPGDKIQSSEKPHGRYILPRYSLHPPTLDGIINDTEPKSKKERAPSNIRSKSPRGYDVEVVIKGSKVIWTQGGVLRKMLDFSSENEIIQQTLFAWLIVNNPSQKIVDRERDRDKEREDVDDIQQLHSNVNPGADRQGRQQALVIILKDTARIYFPSGESFSVHLPLGVHKVWAMDLGLLLERKSEPGEEVAGSMEGTGLPRFYMLMDPFNELQIVTLYQLPKPVLPTKSTFMETGPRIRHLGGVVGDIFNTCVFMSEMDASDRTVVTFDLLLGRHRVWRYASSMPTALPFTKTQSQAGPVDSIAVDGDNHTDLQMRTDTYLFEIESDIQGWSRESTIFGAHYFDGSTVIGVLDHQTEKLSCYQIIADQITVQLWTRPALSAVAVEATRKHLRDILMLSRDGTLQLWTGLAAEVIPCDFNLIQDPLKCRKDGLWASETETSASGNAGLQIVEIKDAVENRVSLVLSDGKILRVCLDFTVRSSLVQECLDALSYALPVEILWDFRHRFLRLHFDKNSKDSNMDEWSNFTTTLLSYCDPSFSQPVMSSPKIQSRQLAGVPKKSFLVEDPDWKFFLESDMHRLLNKHPSFRYERQKLSTPTKNIYTEMVVEAQKLATTHFRGPATRGSLRLDTFYKYILVALHLVYEDRNINLATCNEGDMGPLLMLMSHVVRWSTWTDAYARRIFESDKIIELPEVYMEFDPLPLDLYKYEPPDIFRWISDMVTRPHETKPFPTLASLSTLRDPEQSLFPALDSTPCDQLRKISLFFTSLMSGDDGDQAAVRAIVSESFTNIQLDQLPFGVSVPLREALWKCRRNPSPDLSSDALSFIGRNDLAELASMKNPGYYMKPPIKDRSEQGKRQDIHTLCENKRHQNGEGELETTGTEITNSDITNLRFGADMRIAEVQKMLRSSIVSKVKSEEMPELTEEDDLRAAHQALLCKMAFRTLALPVGRGIFTFGTATPILNQKCPIPPINLSAKVLPTFGVMDLEVASLGGEHALIWPSFHNGVAAGLRISPNSKDVNSSWITYNRPENLDSSHAGFLFALGLTGHLRTLARPHVWRYLSFKHEMTSTGLLLGLACAHRGTMNTAITRVLSVHMPALLPQHGSELNLSPLTQVACVLGIGLIYMETSHRRMTEVMLSEIGSITRNYTDSINNLQECHSVAAGFGLGFITLGQGNKSMGLRDMRIVDVLVSYMPGSVDKNHESRDHGPYAADYGWSQRQPGIEVTSAGATVALGLMYLKTNSKSIASKLDVPETPFLLDYVSPDALILRVICKAIVLWDGIIPTKEWVLSQVPGYLKDIHTGGPPTTESGPQSYYSIIVGACFAMGLRFAGSGNEAAYECILKHLDMFITLGRGSGNGSYEDSITRSVIRTCLDVTTLAAAVVVAGSGRIDLLRRLRKLVRRRKSEAVYGSHLAYHMALGLLFLGGGGYTLGTSNRCVAALLCSLYPRLPNDPSDNRSHLQAFRHLWVLAVEPRCLVTRDAITGACCPVPVRIHLKPAYYQSQIQMVIRPHPASYTNDTSEGGDLQYARYTGLNPSSSQDKAATYFSNSRLDMMTPCLLPELNTISKIEIMEPRYWGITIDLSRENEEYSRIWKILKSGSISVIRHIGHLSYTEDALGMRGIQARPFPKVLTSWNVDDTVGNSGPRKRKQEKFRWLQEKRHKLSLGLDSSYFNGRQQNSPGNEVADQSSASYGEDFCLTFLQDPQVAAFADHLCRAPRGGHATDEVRAAYFTSVLCECLTMDKVETMCVHVWLYDIGSRLDSLGELSWRTLWELRILANYYDTQLKRRLEQHLINERDRTELHEESGRRGRANARQSIAAETALSFNLVAQMLEDDGSNTLIKISRISQLVSKITKRVEQAMNGQVQLGEHDWSADTVARYYFTNGSFPSNSKKQQSIKSQCKTDWFKVWLEQNEIPGPDAIRAIRNALVSTHELWQDFLPQPGAHTESRHAQAGRRMLLKQVFTHAYPAVSLKVLEYLLAAGTE